MVIHTRCNATTLGAGAQRVDDAPCNIGIGRFGAGSDTIRGRDSAIGQALAVGFTIHRDLVDEARVEQVTFSIRSRLFQTAFGCSVSQRLTVLIPAHALSQTLRQIGCDIAFDLGPTVIQASTTGRFGILETGLDAQGIPLWGAHLGGQHTTDLEGHADGIGDMFVIAAGGTTGVAKTTLVDPLTGGPAGDGRAERAGCDCIAIVCGIRHTLPIKSVSIAGPIQITLGDTVLYTQATPVQ